MDISVVFFFFLALPNGAAMNTVVWVLPNMLYAFMLNMYQRVEFLCNESSLIDTAQVFASGSHQQCMKVSVI